MILVGIEDLFVPTIVPRLFPFRKCVAIVFTYTLVLTARVALIKKQCNSLIFANNISIWTPNDDIKMESVLGSLLQDNKHAI